jgi:hypothetical protein
MVMKAELAALRAFKATTTTAVTTGAGKRARVQQDRLPKLRASGELHDPSSTSNSGEKGRRCGNCQYQIELEEPARAKQDPSKSQQEHKNQARDKQEPARVRQEPSKSQVRVKSNDPTTSTSAPEQRQE